MQISRHCINLEIGQQLLQRINNNLIELNLARTATRVLTVNFSLHYKLEALTSFTTQITSTYKFARKLLVLVKRLHIYRPTAYVYLQNHYKLYM